MRKAATLVLPLVLAAACSSAFANTDLFGRPNSGYSSLEAAYSADPFDPLPQFWALRNAASPAPQATVASDARRDVFVRSMAHRGAPGGLSRAVPIAVRVLGAVGVDTVIVETVGVGQVELEIIHTADTVIAAMSPGWGDAIQAAKAGLLEVADVFAVNKADRPGTTDAIRDLDQMLDQGRIVFFSVTAGDLNGSEHATNRVHHRKQSAGDLLGQREFALPQPREQVLARVGQLFQPAKAEESAASLNGMNRPENAGQ